MNGDTRARSTAVQEAMSKAEADLKGVASVSALAGTRLHQQVVSLLPQARSVVAFAMEVFPEVLDLASPSKVMGESSPRDILEPHLTYLAGRLTKSTYDLARACHRQGLKALPMPTSHSSPDQRFLSAILSYKHAAEAAGLGTIGHASLLVTPEFGPRVVLACVLTEAELEPTSRSVDSMCGVCDLCLQACPAGALAEPAKGAPYFINKFACRAFRTGSGSCAECMRVCPEGR